MNIGLLYFAAGAALIFVAAFATARKFQRQWRLKSILIVASVSLAVLGLIWMLLVALSPKAAPPNPPPDYSTITGSGG